MSEPTATILRKRPRLASPLGHRRYRHRRVAHLNLLLCWRRSGVEDVRFSWVDAALHHETLFEDAVVATGASKVVAERGKMAGVRSTNERECEEARRQQEAAEQLATEADGNKRS